MKLDGGLTVRMAWDGRRVVDVALESARAVGACRVLHGRTPDEVLAEIPRLFSLCGHAQSVAAEFALAAARGDATDPARQRDCGRRVRWEAAQEGLLRWGMDLPLLLGEAPLAIAWPVLRRAFDGALRDPGPDAGAAASTAADEALARLLGLSPRAWLDAGAGVPEVHSPAAHWLARIPADAGREARCETLPVPPAGDFLALLSARMAQEPSFCGRPEVGGDPRETGPWARCGTGLAAGLRGRALARLRDVAVSLRRNEFSDAGDDACGAARAGDVGIGWADTARGLLVHRVELSGGRVRRYDVVAPTEWNFHPQGALYKALCGVVAEGEADLRRQAAAWVWALDPCVAWTLEVADA